MAKPIEITIREMQSLLDKVDSMGDWNQSLERWIQNRADNGPREQDLMDLTKFVVQSHDWVKLLISLFENKKHKPQQCQLFESPNLVELQNKINIFLAQHPMDNPAIQVSPKIGGGYFCVIVGRYDTEFIDFIESTLTEIYDRR